MPPTKKPSSKADKDLCRIVTPEFRVSYPHVFKPQAPKPADKKKYSITMLFPKGSELMGYAPGPTMEPRTLQQVIRNAKLAEFGPKENWPEDLESPVVDGDGPKLKDKEGYPGHWVLKAVSAEDQRPSVVDRNMKIIDDPADLYPGCFARAFIYAYVWEYMGRRGVGFILDHVQKTRDGKSFGGKKPVDQVFAPMADVDDSDAEAEEVGDFK